jgi:hypothetical protein
MSNYVNLDDDNCHIGHAAAQKQAIMNGPGVCILCWRACSLAFVPVEWVSQNGQACQEG